MEFLSPFVNFVSAGFDILFHLDVHLANLVQQFGPWIYVILFIIIFAETGLVVTPFLPGDSLLFVAGALTIHEELSLLPLIVTLSIAAILGNQVNYLIGRYFGPRVFHWENSRFFNKESLIKTHQFYEKHGGKTIVISRFLPIFRTFAPFVAGIGNMNLVFFSIFNMIGALLWVISLTVAGHLFGNIPWIKNNLSVLVIVIIAISLAPILIGLLRNKKPVESSKTT